MKPHKLNAQQPVESPGLLNLDQKESKVPIDGATLRAGARRRYDGKGKVIKFYRFVCS